MKVYPIWGGWLSSGQGGPGGSRDGGGAGSGAGGASQDGDNTPGRLPGFGGPEAAAVGDRRGGGLPPLSQVTSALGPQAATLGLGEIKDEDGNPIFAGLPQVGVGPQGIMRGMKGAKYGAAQVRQALGRFGRDKPFGVLQQEAGDNVVLRDAATAASFNLPNGMNQEQAAARIAAHLDASGLGEHGYDITGTMTPSGGGVMLSMNNVPKAHVQRAAQAMADDFGMDAHVLQHDLSPYQRGTSLSYGVLEVQLPNLAVADEAKAILENRGYQWVQMQNPYPEQGDTSFLVLNMDPTTGNTFRRDAFEYTTNENFFNATKEMLSEVGARFSPAGGNVQTIHPSGAAQQAATGPQGAGGVQQAVSSSPRAWG